MSGFLESGKLTFLVIGRSDAVEGQKLPVQILVIGKPELGGHLLDGKTFTQQIAGDDHALLPEPLLGANSNSVLEQTAQVAFGNADAIAKLGRVEAAFFRQIRKTLRKDLLRETHEDPSVLLNDFNFPAFHDSSDC